MRTKTATRRFLFLQGPHGPFFSALSRALRRTGANTLRIGFNGGDRAFWHDRATYHAYSGTSDAWGDWLNSFQLHHEITDLVIYGDSRPIHAEALGIARRHGIRSHIFEEGYLRPFWVTYERQGANGASPIAQIGLKEMRRALASGAEAGAVAPDHWGALRQHVFYGALYHAALMAVPGRAAIAPHRGIPVRAELNLYLRRLAAMPLDRIARTATNLRILKGTFPFHLTLLQLDHDANFRCHGPYADTTAFLTDVIEAFAEGAPSHHHLVLKTHPLEDGRSAPVRAAWRIARAAGIDGRLHIVGGGKLAHLLDRARSVVTVNSTAAQQALWRGLPLKALGRSVYARPDFVSEQSLVGFFAAPEPPDHQAYAIYREFLLQSSQVPGSFYSRAGRRQLLREIVDRILAPTDRYDALLRPEPSDGTRLRVVGDGQPFG